MPDKIYRPEEIPDNPFPEQKTGGLSDVVNVSGETFYPETITETKFPQRVIAGS